VGRNYTRLGYQVQNVTVVTARNYSEVTQAFQESIKDTFKIIVVACVTNLIIASGEAGSTPTERLNAIGETLNELFTTLRLVIILCRTSFTKGWLT